MTDTNPRLNLIERAMQKAQATATTANGSLPINVDPLPKIITANPAPATRAVTGRAGRRSCVNLNFAQLRECRIPLSLASVVR